MKDAKPPSRSCPFLHARARDKFWANAHILCTKGSLAKRLRIMNTTVGGALLWCIRAILPDKHSILQINAFMFRMVAWMMKLKRGVHEEAFFHKVRCTRAAREAVDRFLKVRWSTTWLARAWTYRGHVARAAKFPHPPASSLFIYYRDLAWWETQQRQTLGQRHVGKFFPRLMKFERDLDRAAKGRWQDLAQSRDLWKEALNAWLRYQDVDWAGMSQPSLTL